MFAAFDRTKMAIQCTIKRLISVSGTHDECSSQLGHPCPKRPSSPGPRNAEIGSTSPRMALANPVVQKAGNSFLHCSWHVFWFFRCLVLFIFTVGLQEKFLATIPRVEMFFFSKCAVWRPNAKLLENRVAKGQQGG